VADLLVDTDVLVDHLRGANRLTVADTDRAFVSVITRAELLAGPAEHEEAVTSLLESMGEIEVDRPIASAAGLIRRETGIAMPDALIAATALVGGLALATRNRRDFDRVEGLSIRESPGTSR